MPGKTDLMKSWIPLINLAVATWPKTDWPHWHFYNGADSKKYATKDSFRVSKPCSILIEKMIDKVSESDLDTSDCFPDLDLHGAGMHMIKSGGHLSPHTDSDKHPLTGWYRAYSTILFLTECEGGDLHAVDGDSETVINPSPGSLFTLDSSKIHWVDPVTSGERLTLSVFWWRMSGTGESTRANFSQNSRIDP